jgi:hypothetical protein
MPETASKLAFALGVPPEDLIYGRPRWWVFPQSSKERLLGS